MFGEGTNIENVSNKFKDIISNRDNLFVNNIDNFLENPSENTYNSLRSTCYNILSDFNMPYPRIQIVMPTGCVLIDTYSFELNNFSTIDCINDNHLTRQDFIDCLLNGESESTGSSNTTDFGLLYKSIRIGISKKYPKMIARCSIFNNKEFIINQNNIPGFNYVPYKDTEGNTFKNYNWKQENNGEYFLNISRGKIEYNLPIDNSLKPYLISSTVNNINQNITMNNTFLINFAYFSNSPTIRSNLKSFRFYSPDNGEKLYMYNYNENSNVWELIQILIKNNFS